MIEGVPMRPHQHTVLPHSEQRRLTFCVGSESAGQFLGVSPSSIVIDANRSISPNRLT